MPDAGRDRRFRDVAAERKIAGMGNIGHQRYVSVAMTVRGAPK